MISGVLLIFAVKFCTMINHLAFISGQEVIIIFLVVLLLFGADKIPEIARVFGKGMREFRKVTGEIKREFDDSTGGIKTEIEDMKGELDQAKDDVSTNVRSYLDDSGISEDVKEIKKDLKG
jgi:sec-independent protein translocase protein TatA